MSSNRVGRPTGRRHAPRSFWIANNGEDVVAPNATAGDPTTVDLTQWAATPQLGLLVLDRNDTSHSNRNEATEIQLNINTHNH